MNTLPGQGDKVGLSVRITFPYLHLARRAFLTTCKQRCIDRYFGPLVC
jgi:hypothetical protein